MHDCAKYALYRIICTKTSYMGPYVSFSTNGVSKEQDDKKSVITMSLQLRIPPVIMLPAIVYAAILLANCAAIIGRPLAGTDMYSEIACSCMASASNNPRSISIKQAVPITTFHDTMKF